MKMFITILIILSLFLNGCGTIKQNLLTKPQITITETQFYCGPAAPPLPDQATLESWSDRVLFDKYTEAWKWGERCDKQLQYNHTYFEKALENRAAPSPHK